MGPEDDRDWYSRWTRQKRTEINSNWKKIVETESIDGNLLEQRKQPDLSLKNISVYLNVPVWVEDGEENGKNSRQDK